MFNLFFVFCFFKPSMKILSQSMSGDEPDVNKDDVPRFIKVLTVIFVYIPVAVIVITMITIIVLYIYEKCYLKINNRVHNENVIEDMWKRFIIKETDELKVDTCSICLESMDKYQKIVRLDCEHFYHKDCMNSWFITNKYKFQRKSCPLCRSEIA